MTRSGASSCRLGRRGPSSPHLLALTHVDSFRACARASRLLADSEQSLRSLRSLKLSEQQLAVQVEQLKLDNARMVRLLSSTTEYAYWREFVDDSGGAAYLPMRPAAAATAMKTKALGGGSASALEVAASVQQLADEWADVSAYERVYGSLDDRAANARWARVSADGREEQCGWACGTACMAARGAGGVARGYVRRPKCRRESMGAPLDPWQPHTARPPSRPPVPRAPAKNGITGCPRKPSDCRFTSSTSTCRTCPWS